MEGFIPGFHSEEAGDDTLASLPRRQSVVEEYSGFGGLDRGARRWTLKCK